MSSSENPVPQPPRSVSPTPPDIQVNPPESVPLADNSMDQLSASTLIMDSSAPSQPPEEVSSLSSAELVSTDDELGDDDGASAVITRQQPIPPASEPMQYRAIGLVKGQYQPSEEQFTRGLLLTEDGTLIDAVLLGRVMSLVKKHLDLSQPHLWVVYPRTREKSDNLHVQIVGVWEPEKLHKGDEGEADNADSPLTGAPTEATAETPEEDYFSIRGEILFHSVEENRLIVKIQQTPRKGSTQGKAFKLTLTGTLEGKTVGYFWELDVKREQNALNIRDGRLIALVPPKKRKARPPGGRRPPMGGPKRRWDGPPRDGQRSPARSSDRPATSSAPPARREPLAKPIIKRKDNTEG